MLFDNNEIDTEQEKNAVSEQAKVKSSCSRQLPQIERMRRIIDQGQ